MLQHGNYLCNEVPGHSACQKRISKGNCPSNEGDIDLTSCHGHSHNKKANLPKAMQWLRDSKGTTTTETVGLVTSPS